MTKLKVEPEIYVGCLVPLVAIVTGAIGLLSRLWGAW